MFERILLPVDFTEKNARALEVALDLAGSSRGTVLLIHVIETLQLPVSEVQEFYDQLQDEAEAKMRGMVDGLDEADVALEQHIVLGKRVPELLRFGAQENIDLVIMSSHQIEPDNPDSRLMTISHQIALFADRPVLLLR